MGSSIIIVTWDDPQQADKALKSIKHWQKEKQIEVEDAVVVVKDDQGHVKVKETEHLTTKKGVVFGGVAGLVVGTMLGGPIGGAVLGGAAGALAAKIDLGIPNETIEAVSESMEDASSALFAQLKSVNKALLRSAIRESGGTLHELSITSAQELDLEDSLHAVGGHQQ